MSVYTLTKTSCKLAPDTRDTDILDTMATNSSHVARDTNGFINDTEVNWHIITTAVLCTVAMVSIVTFIVYHYLHKHSGPLWITKFYRQDQYSTMQNKDSKDEQFILGFSNPIIDEQDQTDSTVQPLSYKSLEENTHNNAQDQYQSHQRSSFTRDKISYGEEIGIGWFGEVYKGEANRIVPGLRKTKVVVKKLREESSSEERKRFIEEIAMFKKFNHENVLEVLGVATERQPYIVVFEYNPLGNLKEFLLSHKAEASATKKLVNPVKISIDIGTGLGFLHSKGLYHSDLATRNCIVNSDLSVKIGDYGLSRDRYKEDYYCNSKSTDESIPIRWIDPESVKIDKDNDISVKTPGEKQNVWSFGVTLWEIVEYGRQPYTELTDKDVIQSVIIDRLYQLPEPGDTGMVASQLYDMMKWCWMDADQRPSIQDMVGVLQGLSEMLADTEETEEEPEKPSASTNGYQQPVAIVRPLQLTKPNEDIEEKDNLNSLLKVEQRSSTKNDVEVTAICEEVHDVPVTDITESTQRNELKSDCTTPVTYIGCISKNHGEVDTTDDDEKKTCSESNIVEVKYSDGAPSVIVEDCPPGFVVLPGDRLRRKSSLKLASSKSKGHTVHFPANILDLRVVHRYYREEEEFEISSGEEDGGSPPLDDIDFNDPERLSLQDKESSIDDGNELESALILDRPHSSPVEKRVRNKAKKKKPERNTDEWLFSIDQSGY